MSLSETSFVGFPKTASLKVIAYFRILSEQCAVRYADLLALLDCCFRYLSRSGGSS